MARTTKASAAVVEENEVAVEVVAEETSEDVEAVAAKPATTKASTTAKKQAKETKAEEPTEEPLASDDWIEVVSLIDNVSYFDKQSGDFYAWDEVGQIEELRFDTVKNMWRNHKGYFKNMYLKPLDKRVIKRFDLGRTYEKYDFLMEPENYVSANVDKILDAIASTPNGLRLSLINKVKSLVSSGEVTDASVIKAIDNKLGLNLLSFV